MPANLHPILFFLALFLFGTGCTTLSGGQAQNGRSATDAFMSAGTDGTTPVFSLQLQDPALHSGEAGTLELETADDEDPDAAQVDESVLDAALELIDLSREHWAAGDLDRAIEALDQAYAILLNVPAGAGEKELQQKEDLRFVISKRLTEIYASRFTSVNGNGKEIPLTLNEHVEREIKQFQTYERDFFMESYRRSGRYREQFKKEFRDAGMPEDLAWLPLIESGFKAKALSRARALGLWQFIPSTGYKFGLKRNAWIDERLDPEKSTQAAIAYLRELHQIFGDWATVLAAYNCGEGRVLRIIRQQKINYLDNFWDLYQRLPRETARYYPRFIAVLMIIKEPAKYGFTFDEVSKPLSYETVSIEKPVHLRKLAEKSGVAFGELADLNPELRQEATPGSAYDLKVPAGMGQTILASVEALPKWSPPKLAYVVHRVRRGESLSTIAVRYRTSIGRIMDANNMRNGRLIRIGQKLKIPVRDST